MQTLAKGGYSRDQALKTLQGVYGTREVEFRYELLDDTNTPLMELSNVLDGSINYDSESAIKRTGRFVLSEEDIVGGGVVAIDYLKHRIKPYVRIAVPSIPVPGNLVPATNYEEAVSQVHGKLARWRMDDLVGSTTADDSIGNHDLHHATYAAPGKLGLIEDDGRALQLTSNPTSYTTATNAGDYLNSLYAYSFCGWFQSETVGQDALLISTAQAGTYEALLSNTHNDMAAYTWDQIEAIGGYVAGSSVDTWDAIEASDFTYEQLFTHDNPLVEVTTGLTVSFIGVNRSIEVKFAINDVKVSAETPVNTQTTDRTFFAFTWTTGGFLTLYLNGEQVAQARSDVVGSISNIGDLIFGETFVGLIDDWMFSSGVLTDETIRTLYTTGANIGPSLDEKDQFIEWGQGVFLFSSPTRTIDESGNVTRTVEAYDLSSILDAQNVDETYYVPSGALYTDAVKEILDNTPSIPRYEMTPSTLTLPTQKVWDPGTSHLTIIDDLLSAINYEPLYFDESGVGQIQPHIDPAQRTAEYVYDTSLVSVLIPSASQTLDLFNQPNKWVLLVNDPDRVVLKSTVTNDDPGSPTSTVNRGRTITAVLTGQDAADQFSLDEKAKKLAQEASQVYEEVEFYTSIMPMHTHRDVYALSYPGLGVQDTYTEASWSYNLVAGDKMKHVARRVIQLGSV